MADADVATWGTPFIPVETCNNSQLFLLTCIYGYALYQSSNLISNGSEYLLLIPSVAGLVGSIVLPILGAVPDGMMTLMSGMGPDAQSQIGVGVGVLAGSSVMLLCIPWCIAVWFGRVPLGQDGSAQYNKRTEVAQYGSGVSFSTSIPKNAKIMLGTTLLYLIIQIPATHSEEEGVDLKAQAQVENFWALVGLVLCVCAFCGYLIYCYMDANEDKVLAAVIDGIKNKTISLQASLNFASKHNGASGQEALLKKDEEYLKKVMTPFFRRYDNTEPRGSVDEKEFEQCCKDLGIKTQAEKSQLWKDTGVKKDGAITLEQFCRAVMQWGKDHKMRASLVAMPNTVPDEEDEEEEEMPDDLADLSPAKQRQSIIMRASWMMGLGTAVVLVISDPFVEVLSEVGKRAGISGFYIAFVLAPLASNASELLAAYNYAVKKTQKSISTSLSTLIGAACMNNTFCLAIFLALIYVKELAWQFQAETAAIMIVQLIIGTVAITKTTHSTTTGFLILSCYPLCIFLVWALENLLGWD